MVTQNILPLIADRFLNTPLLIDPAKAATIYGVLQGRIAADIPLDADGIDIEDDAADALGVEANRLAGTHRRSDGNFSWLRRNRSVALIDITGSLVNRGAWIGASSGLTSYEGIAALIDKAHGDDEIRSAILDVNSPGGEATGLFSVARKIRELAAIKPVVAVVNDIAASAAYGIASAAREIVISPTSFVGSIGVVMVHIDHSGEMEQKGLKATLLHAGKNKVDGHPFGPLSKDVRASLQARVDILYDRLLETVEAGRGTRLSAAAARETEAKVYIGQQAVELGIADRIGTFDQVLEELQRNAPRGRKTENVAMAYETNGPKSEGATITQADHDKAVADARAAGAKEATDRIGAIMSCDEARGREALAAHFAFKTSMGVEDAKASLAVASKDTGGGEETVPTPEQRALAEPEIGADDPRQDQPGADHGWGDVTAEINRRTG